MKYRSLDLITAAFAVVLVLSNIVSTKIISLGAINFDGGLVLFPLAYIFGDILTEVYGYARARRVIWVGFAMNILMVATFWTVGILPAASDWPNQGAYDAILGVVPRIVLGSLVAYLAGEFLNSFVLAKMKLRAAGKRFWQRAIASTAIGQFFDTTIFLGIAFWGILPLPLLISIWLTNYMFKIALEIALLPITYRAVAWLKKTEGTDHFDRDTDFHPLHLEK